MTARRVGTSLGRRRQIVLASAAIACVAIVAGCSSAHSTNTAASTSTSTAPPSSAPAPSGPAIEPSFQARATAICRTAGSALRSQGSFPFPDFDPEHPDATKLPVIAQYEAKTVATMRTWQTQLHALGQPTTGSGVWNTFLAAVDASVTSTIAQQRAARRRDSAAFTQTYVDLTAHGLAGTQAAAAIGAPNCDPSHLTG